MRVSSSPLLRSTVCGKGLALLALVMSLNAPVAEPSFSYRICESVAGDNMEAPMCDELGECPSNATLCIESKEAVDETNSTCGGDDVLFNVTWTFAFNPDCVERTCEGFSYQRCEFDDECDGGCCALPDVSIDPVTPRGECGPPSCFECDSETGFLLACTDCGSITGFGICVAADDSMGLGLPGYSCGMNTTSPPTDSMAPTTSVQPSAAPTVSSAPSTSFQPSITPTTNSTGSIPEFTSTPSAAPTSSPAVDATYLPSDQPSVAPSVATTSPPSGLISESDIIPEEGSLIPSSKPSLGPPTVSSIPSDEPSLAPTAIGTLPRSPTVPIISATTSIPSAITAVPAVQPTYQPMISSNGGMSPLANFNTAAPTTPGYSTSSDENRASSAPLSAEHLGAKALSWIVVATFLASFSTW